jgi:spore maturation protein CgeB
MRIVIFGLTISSSWGNGHATLWRGLCRALATLGHECIFFERDAPYYAHARDCTSLPYARLNIYSDWDEARPQITAALANADAAIVTSYCPDALSAAEAIFNADVATTVFYDLDTPVTLSALRTGNCDYIDVSDGLARFDLVLSYTGGAALEQLQSVLGARQVAPLYGHVDPQTHYHVDAVAQYRCDLSYLGTYASDRQRVLEELFVEPARTHSHRRFMIGGAQYPTDFPWSSNIWFVRHLPPSEHSAFFCSSRLTLNVTRAAMAELGWCPSGRLFEAAACGATLLSDEWDGLSDFYTPGEELLVVNTAQETLSALDRSDAELQRIGAAARERTLDCHTSLHRARELIALLEAAAGREVPVHATSRSFVSRGASAENLVHSRAHVDQSSPAR